MGTFAVGVSYYCTVSTKGRLRCNFRTWFQDLMYQDLISQILEKTGLDRFQILLTLTTAAGPRWRSYQWENRVCQCLLLLLRNVCYTAQSLQWTTFPAQKTFYTILYQVPENIETSWNNWKEAKACNNGTHDSQGYFSSRESIRQARNRTIMLARLPVDAACFSPLSPCPLHLPSSPILSIYVSEPRPFLQNPHMIHDKMGVYVRQCISVLTQKLSFSGIKC